LLVPHAPALVAKAVELALDGNEGALRICIDRLMPSLKAESLPVALEGVDGSLAEQGLAILRSMASGQIAADCGARMMQALQMQASIESTVQFEERLAALEKVILSPSPKTLFMAMTLGMP
jgi:hypothetical protein